MVRFGAWVVVFVCVVVYGVRVVGGELVALWH